MGNHHGVPSQETGGSGSGSGGIYFDMRPSRHSNVCHRTVMADTQVLEHSVESGLDNKNRLLWRVTHVCELCLSTVAVKRYRRESRAAAVESFRKLVPRNKSTLLLLYVSFCFLFFFLVWTIIPAVCCDKRTSVRFVSFSLVFFLR